MRTFSLRCLLLLMFIVGGCAVGGGGGDLDTGPRFDTSPSTCGNGSLEPAEECDGDNLAGATCEAFGFSGGVLTCRLDCILDKSDCEVDDCGNGSLESGEDCDGVNLGGATCEARGYTGGTLSCAACRYDETGCTSCGNGVIDSGEECDGTALGAASCSSRGFSGGTLLCDGRCGFDESGCTDASCGNGRRDEGEDCDGADLGGSSCADAGFVMGTLACNATCGFDTSACRNCGNGRVDAGEECDAADLGGADCSARGFTGGTLACTADCAFNESGCTSSSCGDGMLESGEDCDDGGTTPGDGCSASCRVEAGFDCTGSPSSCAPRCGDGMVVAGEECDGSALAGETCASRGFESGTLACRTCTFDTSGCVAASSCGDGTIDDGEECDDGGTAAFDGCGADCQVEPTFHLPVRLRGGEGSNHGKVEVFYESTWRDVCDDVPGNLSTAAGRDAFANVVCRQLGYTGSGHEATLGFGGFGGGSGMPVMDDVDCTGSEDTLAQCDFAGWNVEDCGSGEAIGVRCAPGEGDIRLVDGPSGLEGRLQIFHSGSWGEVCDDFINITETYYGAETVCHQLGYTGGTFIGSYDAPSSDFILDNVRCGGTELRIEDCPANAWGDENCGATEGAGFSCTVHRDGDSRLVTTSARNRGRVEVLHNNIWGTFCDDGITSGTSRDNFVRVGCRELGFGTDGLLLTSGFDDGVDPTWRDDVRCGTFEGRLSSCPAADWGVENCSHFEDVGLNCTP